MKTNRIDRIYKNSGRSLATRITQNALDISRSNARDNAPWNSDLLMSKEGAALAKNSAPRSAFEVVGLDDRERLALADTDPRMWQKFRRGDATPWDDETTARLDPLEDDPELRSLHTMDFDDPEEETEELDPEAENEDEDEDEVFAENESLARTEGAFDRERLYRAIDRLTRKSKRKLGRGHDGRSYGRDGRSYSVCTGCLGGIDEWNRAYDAGELC